MFVERCSLTLGPEDIAVEESNGSVAFPFDEEFYSEAFEVSPDDVPTQVLSVGCSLAGPPGDTLVEQSSGRFDCSFVD